MAGGDSSRQGLLRMPSETGPPLGRVLVGSVWSGSLKTLDLPFLSGHLL